MKIRLATNDDIPNVMQIVRGVVPLMRAAGNLQWDDAYPNTEVFQQDVQLSQLWVAEVDGAVAGVAAITTDQDSGYAQVGWDITELAIVVHRIAVHPEYSGRGIAAALMQQAERVALERGIAKLRVDTNTQNQVTQRLFPKLGYTLTGEITLDHRPGLKFLCYEKQLQKP